MSDHETTGYTTIVVAEYHRLIRELRLALEENEAFRLYLGEEWLERNSDGSYKLKPRVVR